MPTEELTQTVKTIVASSLLGAIVTPFAIEVYNQYVVGSTNTSQQITAPLNTQIALGIVVGFVSQLTIRLTNL
jgi:hypothetical protein